MAIQYFGQQQVTVDQLADTIFEDLKPIIQEEAAKIAYLGGYGSSRGLSDTRRVFDAVVPTLVLISYSDVEKELLKYRSIGDETNPYEIQSSELGSKKVVNKRIGRVKEVIKKETINAIVDTVKKGVANFISKTKPQVTSYKTLLQEIEIQSYSNKKVWTAGKVFKIQESVGKDIDAAFVFSDYVSTSTLLQTELVNSLTTYLKNLNAADSLDGLKAFLDLGHSVARLGLPDDEDEFYANFPKLSGIIIQKVMEAAVTTGGTITGTTVNTASIVEDFLNYTGQLNNSLNVSKEFAEGFLRAFVRVGGQVLKLENSIINRYRGSQFESKFGGSISPEVINQLTVILKDKLSIFNKEFNNNPKVLKIINENIQRLFPAATSSPSMLSYIEDSLINILKTGKGLPKFVNNKNYKPKNVPSIGTNIKTSAKKVVTKPKKLKPLNVSVPKLNIKNQGTNLTQLQTLLNVAINAQVRLNMGTGNRRDVLNYRSGRFAESVKVERLSESRQGMITAFYSYMKNPYATFSTGGRQELPRTRDPKTLIARSIREVAQTLVTNRLRAVNV